MIRIIALLIVCVSGLTSLAQDSLVHSIFLIGDAGKDSSTTENLRALKFEISRFPESTVLFLGDNIYHDGLSGKDGSEKRKRQEKKILTQINSVVGHTGKVYFIPGNHDWKAGRWKGLETMQRQAEFVTIELGKGKSIKNERLFLPSSGMPGPEVENLADGLKMIAIDTQWWLHSQFFHKVNRPRGLNRKETQNLFFKRLDSLMNVMQMAGDQIVIAAHHPLFSNGHHGSPKEPLRFLINYTPFQIFGLMGLNRMLVQDIPQPRYKKMKRRLLRVLENYPGVIFISGHEHNLQYHTYDDDHFLISGSGSKISELVGDRYPAKFMEDRYHGFMRLDIHSNGKRICHVYNGDQGSIEEVLELN